jgi:hypothetical protein
MNLYIVKPNLQVANLSAEDSCPSETTLLSKKYTYLALLHKCKKLLELNGGAKAAPRWCDNLHMPEESKEKEKDNDKCPSHNRKHSHSHSHSHTNEHCTAADNSEDAIREQILQLPLQSITLTEEDLKGSSNYTTSTTAGSSINTASSSSTSTSTSHDPLERLGIPIGITPSERDGKWLAFKYMQILSDIALVRYKYLKSNAKVNTLAQKYLCSSRTDIEPNADDDAAMEEGLAVVSAESNKCSALEHVLCTLLDVCTAFEKHFRDVLPGQGQFCEHLH